MIATDNVGNSRQMYIIRVAWKYQSNCNLFKRMRNFFYDVHKWLDDVEVEQVVMKISFLIWEMHQSDWEKL